MEVQARRTVSRHLLVGAIAILLLGAPVPGARAEEAALDSTLFPGAKSGNTAFAYSLLGTALPGVASSIILSTSDARVGPALLPSAAGYLVGPSLGHFYAGRPKRAWVGIGIRSAAGLGFAGGLAIVEDDGDAPGAVTLMIVCVGVGVMSTLADIFEAPHSARIHNDGLRQGNLHVTPAAIGVARAPGLRADLTF